MNGRAALGRFFIPTTDKSSRHLSAEIRGRALLSTTGHRQTRNDPGPPIPPARRALEESQRTRRSLVGEHLEDEY